MGFTWSNKPTTGGLIKIATINEITSNANTVLNCSHCSANKITVYSNNGNHAHTQIACSAHNTGVTAIDGKCNYYIHSNSKCRGHGG